MDNTNSTYSKNLKQILKILMSMNGNRNTTIPIKNSFDTFVIFNLILITLLYSALSVLFYIVFNEMYKCLRNQCKKRCTHISIFHLLNRRQSRNKDETNKKDENVELKEIRQV